ncbi:3-oxo-5-alpha-steroid 4-dehydrogenase [Clavispora lusitaniae]|nr:3-oxo-5-alpha-steroid 4-dehydrogenase [Clavispora lusitaniae]
MHISHYFVGLYFYVCVAIVSFCGLVVAQEESKRPRQWLAIAFFALFSVDQYNNHRHLAALVKYSVPTFGMFRHVACAHYCDEIVIYFAVTVAAWTREPNMEVSVALFSAWVFVLVNLSVSGLESLRYYQTKFDDYTVQYAVVPFLL